MREIYGKIYMKKNEGTFDRVIRLTIAIVLLFLSLQGDVFTPTMGVAVMVISIVLLVTSIMGICPLYSLLGIRTNKDKKA
jgi:hypothetical protein